jgi:hypothetical protein
MFTVIMISQTPFALSESSILNQLLSGDFERLANKYLQVMLQQYVTLQNGGTVVRL